MSKNTELKLPKNYKRPSEERFRQAYATEVSYEDFFAKYEAELAERYAAGEVTDENFIGDDEMADADGDGLPDVLHVQSQVRAVTNRMQRVRQPTRHRFKQYLFGNPSLRLVRKRVLHLSAAQVRAGIDELIAKEAVGILSVHAPNGARINLQALKSGQVVMAPVAPTPPLPSPPLDSAANDIPAGEHMPLYTGGTFVGDPIATDVVQRMASEKAEEAEKKDPTLSAASTEPASDPLDPVDASLNMGVDDSTAPIVDQLPQDSEASVEAPAVDPLVQAEPAEATQVKADSSSKKGVKKGSHR